MKVTFYTDPQHGWLKVKRSELSRLNIANSISNFSYQLGEYVYLEEDCDANLYLEKLQVKPEFEIKHTNKSSRIRSYSMYDKDTKPVSSRKISAGQLVKVYGETYKIIRKAIKKGCWIVEDINGREFIGRATTFEIN